MGDGATRHHSANQQQLLLPATRACPLPHTGGGWVTRNKASRSFPRAYRPTCIFIALKNGSPLSRLLHHRAAVTLHCGRYVCNNPRCHRCFLCNVSSWIWEVEGRATLQTGMGMAPNVWNLMPPSLSILFIDGCIFLLTVCTLQNKVNLVHLP